MFDNFNSILSQAVSNFQKGNLEDAKKKFIYVLNYQPKNIIALEIMALIYATQGHTQQALKYFEKIIKVVPQDARAWSNRGNALQLLGQYKQALASCDKAIELAPDLAEAWLNRGNALLELKQFEQAIASSDKALSINSNFAQAWYNRGNALLQLKQYDHAIASFDKAIGIDSSYSDAWSNRGVALEALRQYDLAIDSYDKAISIKPNNAEAWSSRGKAFASICLLELSEASYREAIRYAPDLLIARNGLILTLNYQESFNAENSLKEAIQFGLILSKKATPKFKKWINIQNPKKLNIGFVSGDFNNHSVGYFLEGLIKNIDQNSFEIFGFPTQSFEDDLTDRIKPYFREWTPIFDKSDLDASHIIHQKGIHILIDLSGHTSNNRLPVFAYKPAPVQVTWLGLPSTTGVPEIDFVIGDPYALPEEYENQFTETVWRLRESYLCLTPPHEMVEFGDLPALKNGFITFGSFNNLSKMNGKVVETWARILKLIPTAKLLLKTGQLDNQKIRDGVSQQFISHGIGIDRLLLNGLKDNRVDHLNYYNKVDLALDTFPYPGVTTSAEALWMGVPVLTLKGNSFLSSTPVSIAKNLGLDDWVANDINEYVNKAVQFSTVPDRLDVLRRTIREYNLSTPLYDAPRFAKNFGEALWSMWQQRLR